MDDQKKFCDFENPEEGLKTAARVAIEHSLKVKRGEKVLIITNPMEDVFEISQALYDAAAAVGAEPVLMVQPEKTLLDFAHKAVIGAIGSVPDVLISMSSEKLGKDEEAIKKPFDHNGKKVDNTFHYLMETKKTRSFWSPGVTKEAFIKTVPVDYNRMNREAQALKEVLDRAEAVKITAPGGTDLVMGLKGRKAFLDDGNFSAPGSGGNLPAGEAFVSPELGATNGTIGFDGSIAVKHGTVFIEDPIVCKVENGFITSIDGGKEAEILLDTITQGEDNALTFEREGKLPGGTGESYRKNARNLGELGIGLNPAAQIMGNMLVDEKVYKTCHIAIGSNYDEDAPALIHLDGVIKDPTIIAVLEDGSERVLLEDGVLRV